MTIIAVDVGSSSVRAIVYRGDPSSWDAIATAQRSYQFETDASGKAIIAANTLRTHIEACLDALLSRLDAPIDAVGLDTFAGNWLAVDDANTPLTPVITYADTRGAVPEVASPAALHQRTGAPLARAYYPAQLSLLESLVDDMTTVHQIVDVGTWLYRGWFGRDDVPMSYSLASWSGMLNQQMRDWDTGWLDTLGLPRERFPVLADYDTAQRGLSNDYAKRWAALVETPFFLAVGDGAAAQVGSGAVATDSAALTMGTTAALRTVIHARTDEAVPDVPDGGWRYLMDARHYLLGGALSEGGNVFAWAERTLQLDRDTLEADIAAREPGAHGLTVLPLLNGERSPGWRGDATGTLHGLRLDTSAVDMVQALMESVALRLAQIGDQVGIADRARIMASGGALQQSRVWVQMVADALGRPLHVLDTPESTALGTAQLAWCALRGRALEAVIEEAAPDVREVITPDADAHAVYVRLLREQQALYRRLWRNG